MVTTLLLGLILRALYLISLYVLYLFLCRHRERIGFISKHYFHQRFLLYSTRRFSSWMNASPDAGCRTHGGSSHHGAGHSTSRYGLVAVADAKLSANVVNGKAVPDGIVCLLGPTALQLYGYRSVDLRQMIYACFAELMVKSIPGKRGRAESQQELRTFLSKHEDLSPAANYLDGSFDSLRRPIFRLISKLVAQVCSQSTHSLVADGAQSLAARSAPLRESSSLELRGSRYTEDFNELAQLGSGGFGRVYKVRSRVDSQLYAIKRIVFRPAAMASFTKMLSECRLHASLEHAHIVRYHNAWIEINSEYVSSRRKTSNGGRGPGALVVDNPPTSPLGSFVSDDACALRGKFWQQATHDDECEDSVAASQEAALHASYRSSSTFTTDTGLCEIPVLHIQMEFCDSTLGKYMRDRGAIDTDFNAEVMRGLLSAVVFLHTNGIIHRDIKPNFQPSNVLLKRASGGFRVLLSDFGLACEANSPEPLFNEEMTSPEDVLLTSHIGTPLYAAPEQIGSRRYDQTVDIYSLGVVFFELYSTHHTWMERAECIKQLRDNGRVSAEFTSRWPSIGHIIDKMVSRIPAERLPGPLLLAEFETCVERSEKDALRRQVSGLEAKNAEMAVELIELRKKYTSLLLSHLPRDNSESISKSHENNQKKQ